MSKEIFQFDKLLQSNLSWDPTTAAAAGSSLVAITAAVYATSKIIQNRQESKRIQEAIDLRRAERELDLDQLRDEYILNDEAMDIVHLSFEQLTDRLQKRTLTSVQVLRAFIAKAVHVTSIYNCITEFVPDVLEIARELDSRKDLKGPLHGLPFCITDDNNIRGMDTTLGLGKNLNKPAEENSILVQTLIDLGAVPFCKTNVPQSLCNYRSHNPIYGETLNNRNIEMTPGGSSGGTACLVADDGAPFGTGTDIGGSLRIPAHFSGLCAIRPTENRLSAKGIQSSLPKCVGLKRVPGIIAKDAKTVAEVFRALTLDNRQNLYDSQALPISWNEEIFRANKPLTIGYFTSLSFFPSIGDVGLTVLRAKTALESMGHTLVPFVIDNDWNIVKLMLDIISVDFGTKSNLSKLFANEPCAEGLGGLRFICGQPDWLRRFTQYLNPATWWGTSYYSSRATFIGRAGLDQNSDMDVWDLMNQRDQLISAITSKMEKSNMDLILGPAFPFSACRLQDCEQLFGAVLYTMMWNLVDFPAGVVPFGTETGEYIDSYVDEGDSVLRLAKESTKESIGSLIGVQLIGKPFKEELVLRTMVQLSGKRRSL